MSIDNPGAAPPAGDDMGPIVAQGEQRDWRTVRRPGLVSGFGLGPIREVSPRRGHSPPSTSGGQPAGSEGRRISERWARASMKRAARLHPLLYAGYPILALL